MKLLSTEAVLFGVAVYFAIASYGASSRADQAERKSDCYEAILLALERPVAQQQKEYEFVVTNGFKNNPKYNGIQSSYDFQVNQLSECFRTGGVG